MLIAPRSEEPTTDSAQVGERRVACSRPLEDGRCTSNLCAVLDGNDGATGVRDTGRGIRVCEPALTRCCGPCCRRLAGCVAIHACQIFELCADGHVQSAGQLVRGSLWIEA